MSSWPIVETARHCIGVSVGRSANTELDANTGQSCHQIAGPEIAGRLTRAQVYSAGPNTASILVFSVVALNGLTI
jgi:hypothetical protein